MGKGWGAGLSAGSRSGCRPGLRVRESTQVQTPAGLVRNRSTWGGACCQRKRLLTSRKVAHEWRALSLRGGRMARSLGPRHLHTAPGRRRPNAGTRLRGFGPPWCLVGKLGSKPGNLETGFLLHRSAQHLQVCGSVRWRHPSCWAPRWSEFSVMRLAGHPIHSHGVFLTRGAETAMVYS